MKITPKASLSVGGYGMYHKAMPTVLRIGPYRFFFFAGDREEPTHIHVERDDCQAKYWLNPVRLQHSYGFAANEIQRIERLVSKNQQGMMERWNEFFNG